MVKGFIFFRDGKIPFVIENYHMELFTDDPLLDDFCKEYNFKENYILHGQCFDIGIRGRKATFLVENSMGSTCYLRCYTINMFDKDEEYDSIGLQSPSLDEVFRYEYEYIDMVRAGINLAIEPKVVYKVPFGMNDQKYELEFRIGHDNRLGLLEDLDRKCELILPLHTNEIQECYDIERKSNDLRDRYCLYAKKRISEMGTPITVPPLNEKNWQTFIIKDIADVYSGHDIYAQERVNGKTPLVTAVGINNGVGYFVSNENNSKAEESISVVRNGASVGKAFYHKYSALYGNDCRRMKLKHSHSEFVNLFITQVIGMQNKAFSYSRKLGTERLLNLRIMLPVTDDGAPDYKYMEQYVKNLMSRKYKQYLAYLDSKEKTDTIATSD